MRAWRRRLREEGSLAEGREKRGRLWNIAGRGLLGVVEGLDADGALGEVGFDGVEILGDLAFGDDQERRDFKNHALEHDGEEAVCGAGACGGRALPGLGFENGRGHEYLNSMTRMRGFRWQVSGKDA